MRPESYGITSYESHGSIHKQLTFSEFSGQSYEADISEKFIEYLKQCCRASSIQRYPSISADPRFSAAKVDRQLHTLNPSMAMGTNPPPTSSVAAHTSGPIRTQRKSTQAQMQTGPMPPALKARVLANISSRTSKVNKMPANVTTVSSVDTESTGQVERWAQSTVHDALLGNELFP